MIKNISLLFILVAFVGAGNAQVPQLLNYQAIVRNEQGQPLTNTLVNFRFQILGMAVKRIL